VSIGLAVAFAALFVARAARDVQRSWNQWAPHHGPSADNGDWRSVSHPTVSRVAFTAKSADGRVPRLGLFIELSRCASSCRQRTRSIRSLVSRQPLRWVRIRDGAEEGRRCWRASLRSCNRCGPAIGSRVFRAVHGNSAGVIVCAISSDGLWRISDTGAILFASLRPATTGIPAFFPMERTFYLVRA
jgi:hypothetical protein